MGEYFSPYTARCSECGCPIPDVEYAWTSITGWDKKRRGGGTNHVALRKPTGEWMCDACMQKCMAGIATGQLSLAP